jgi:hypothetical protein
MTPNGWPYFIALAVIWGMPYLFIKIAVRDLDLVVIVRARAVRRQWRALLCVTLIHCDFRGGHLQRDVARKRKTPSWP